MEKQKFVSTFSCIYFRLGKFTETNRLVFQEKEPVRLPPTTTAPEGNINKEGNQKVAQATGRLEKLPNQEDVGENAKSLEEEFSRVTNTLESSDPKQAHNIKEIMVRYLKSHGASKEYNPDTTTIHQLAEETLKLYLKKYALDEVLEAKFPGLEMQKTRGKILILEEIFEWAQQENDSTQQQKINEVQAYIVPRLQPLLQKVHALQRAKKE